MLNIKEYETYKTITKTAKENNLTKGDNKSLFDFTLLDNIDITEIEKQVIINSSIKHIHPSNKVDFYGKLFDNFTACDGITRYNCHKVFSSATGKFLYAIFELTNIEHYSKSRNSIYDNNYNVVTHTANSKTMSPLNDIEVA